MLDTFLQRITEPTPRLRSSFGSVIKFSDSGNVMLVNAPALSSSPQVIGKTYIYNRSGTQWTFLEEIVYPAFVTALDHPSAYCEMNFDGTILAISIQDYDATPITNGGVMIFVLVGNTYVYRSLLRVNPRITPPSGNVLNIFGFHMAFDDAGKTLVVSAPFDINAAERVVGGVYVFETVDAWTSFSYVELYHDENGDNLGLNVAISGDGKIIVAGRTSATQPGSAPTWEKTGDTWPDYADNIPVIATFTASDGVIDDRFAFSDHLGFFIHTGGNAISVNFDGSVIAIGASGIGTGGQVYIFNRFPSAFIEYQLIAPVSSELNIFFGWSIKLNSLGTRIVISAQAENVMGFDDVGVNYIYQDDGSSFIEVDKISAPVPLPFTYGAFRPVISPDGKYLASGSIDETINGLVFAGVVNIWALGNVPINRPDKFAVLVKKEDANFTATTAQLADITSDVNNFYKFPKKKVVNTDTGKTEVTNGWAPSDPWSLVGDGLTYSEFKKTLSPISYWRVGEKIGTVAIDEMLLQDGDYLSTNITVLPVLGQPGLVINDVDTSVLLVESNNNVIDVQTQIEYNFTDGVTDYAFSFEVLISTSIVFKDNPIIGKTGVPNTVNNEYLFGINANNEVYCILYEQGRTDLGHHFWSMSIGTIKPNTTHHITVTFDGSINSGKIYLDGVEVSVDYTTLNYTSMFPTNTNLAIGAAFIETASEQFFDGFIDDIVIYDYELSSSQVLANYNKGIGL